MTESQPLKSQKLIEKSEFAVLHISQAVIDKCEPGKKVKLVAKNGKEGEVVLAILSDRNEQTHLDIYINATQQVELTVVGSKTAEIHLSGYFEPKGDEMEDDMFYGGEDDESEEEEEVGAAKGKDALAMSLQKAVENSKKNAHSDKAKAPVAMPDSDEEEEEEELSELDEEEMDLDEEEEEEEEEMPLPSKKHDKHAAKKEAPKESKKPAPAVEDSDDEDDDEDDLLGDYGSDDEDDEEMDLAALIKKQ